MEKEKILANLYSLKTGLCLINDEKTLLESKRQSYLDAKEQNTNNTLAQNAKIKQIKELKQNIQNEENNIAQINANYNNKINRIETNDPNKDLKERQKKAISSDYSIVFIILIACIAYIINFHTNTPNGDGMKFILLLICYGVAGIAAIFAIIIMCSHISTASKAAQERARSIKVAKDYAKDEYTSNLNYAYSKLNNLKEQLKQCENELNSLKLNLPALDKKCANAKKIFDDTAKIHIPIAQAIFECLYEKYDTIFVVDNWEVLDYVIYALQTGRSDTIKEALHYADEERRFNKLLDLIQIASEYIAKTINTSFDRLQNHLSYHFSNIQSAISEQTNKVIASNMSISKEISDMKSATISQIQQATSKINDSLGNIYTVSQTHTEILEKMKTSSMSLASDMRFFMESEYQYFR